ncbi:chemosensory receptor A [Elysia marginata]|uniref:Chemosensory receptor A n=1 Tax=Elysia marginata TaxID=1093978 RepID=A0AAV4GSY8_9GAST|nr:chemosensory receptor A [Elysia marginata]
MSTIRDNRETFTSKNLGIFDDLLDAQEMTSLKPLVKVTSGPELVEVLTGPEALLANTVIYTLVCVISVVGIFVNIINIAVFIKLGLSKETINIGMFALSVADLLTLVTLFLMGLVNCPLYPFLHIPIVPYDATLLLTGPFMSASATSHCITALISVERCVCVVKPFHVKRIFTVGRVRLVVVIIWAIIMLGAVPKYATTNIAWRLEPDTNTTKLVFEYTPEMRQVEELTIQIMNVFIPFLVYLVVVVCTVILVVKLREALRWQNNMKKKMHTSRNAQSYSSNANTGSTSTSVLAERMSTKKLQLSNDDENGKEEMSVLKRKRKNAPCEAIMAEEPPTPPTISQNISADGHSGNNPADSNKTNSIEVQGHEGQPPAVTRPNQKKGTNSNGKIITPQGTHNSIRELRVHKSVVLICAIFLTCTSPTVILISIYLVWPKFHVDTPEFQNLMHLLISFPFLTQAVSSSVNIIFYMRMSSRFRPVCVALFQPLRCPRGGST